ncbi:hypothetical protein Tco_1258106 [Tanacetum coccineum]
MAARDSDDALVCCVKNTVEDRIIDSGASFHATYCKEELERFKLRSGKVRLADDKTLNIAGVRDVVLKTSFGTSWTLKDVRWFGEAEEGFLHNVRKDKETAETAPGFAVGYNANLQDTSLAYLKVFGCDSFVKVKDVCGEAMKCTFIGSNSDEMRYSFRIRRVTRLSEAKILHLWTRFMDPENDSIFVEHGLSSKISQSPRRNLDTSSKTPHVRRSSRESRAPVRYSPSANYLLLTENGEPESYSEAFSSKESVQWKKAINEEMVSLEKNQTCSLVRLPARKKASQSLWMFKVKEEQNVTPVARQGIIL